MLCKTVRYYSQRVYVSLANGDLVVFKRNDEGKNLRRNLPAILRLCLDFSLEYFTLCDCAFYTLLS